MAPITKDINKLKAYLGKALDYEEIEEICGERNSYYKTDKDATAMCLKEDYCSGLGSNMHAGYNVQLIVSKGIIVALSHRPGAQRLLRIHTDDQGFSRKLRILPQEAVCRRGLRVAFKLSIPESGISSNTACGGRTCPETASIITNSTATTNGLPKWQNRKGGNLL